MTQEIMRAARLALWPFGPASLASAGILLLIAFDVWKAAPVSSPKPVAPGQGERISYTVFHTVPHGALEIVTGRRFDRSAQARPSSQYCYVAAPGAARTSITLSLARQNGEGRVTLGPFGAGDGEPFGLSPEQLRDLAQHACRFAAVFDAAPMMAGARPLEG